ncbi:MAG: hypothetical protein LBL34_04155 [Clostridiales bacterium]|jgi:hypothetical protein|nr:hypothetical protein [Clostridiales bacterium]
MKIEFTKEKPRCEMCLHSTKMYDGNYLCKRKKGVMTFDYACHKFLLDITASGNKRRHLHNMARLAPPAAII